MPNLGLFVGALSMAYLLPGADMLLLLQTGASRGRLAALATALGLAVARAAHVALAAFGLASLLRTSPWAFEAFRLAGTAYLIWLGISVLRGGGSPVTHAASEQTEPFRGYGAAFRRGLITSISNPKALFFCSILLPQFIQHQSPNVAGQFVLLGIVLLAVGLAFDAVYALAGAAIGRFLRGNEVALRVQRWVFSSLLIGVGLRLALAPRPQ